VLPVGVDADGHGVTARVRFEEPRPEGGALAAVAPVPEDDGAGRPRHVASAVRRAVVDHDDRDAERRMEVLDDAPDGGGRVQGRDDGARR
jgi:hypothetical protein